LATSRAGFVARAKAPGFTPGGQAIIVSPVPACATSGSPGATRWHRLSAPGYPPANASPGGGSFGSTVHPPSANPAAAITPVQPARHMTIPREYPTKCLRRIAQPP
jgi:hypothetical protein